MKYGIPAKLGQARDVEAAKPCQLHTADMHAPVNILSILVATVGRVLNIRLSMLRMRHGPGLASDKGQHVSKCASVHECASATQLRGGDACL